MHMYVQIKSLNSAVQMFCSKTFLYGMWLYKNVERVYKIFNPWSASNPEKGLMSCCCYTLMCVCKTHIWTTVVSFPSQTLPLIWLFYTSNTAFWRTEFKQFPLLTKTLQWDVKIGKGKILGILNLQFTWHPNLCKWFTFILLLEN